MTLDELSTDQVAALLPALEDLRHDLGKYVCFETRFVGLDAELETLRQAVMADVRSTRRQARGTLSAWELWTLLRPSMLEGDPDVTALDLATRTLREADLDGPRAELLQAAAGATQIQQATRRLHDRARRRLRDAGIDPDDL